MSSDGRTPDDGLRAAFEDRVFDWPDVTTQVLFGYPAYRVTGTVFAVLDAEGIALTRLPANEEATLVQDHDTGPFEAYGQTIGRWTHVTADADDLEHFLPFVRASYETARSGTRDVPPPDEDR